MKKILSSIFLIFAEFIKKNKGVLVDLTGMLLVKTLKLQASGGVLGWLVKTLVTEFSEEVYDFIKVNVENVEIKIKLERTVDIEDRNEATDILNDIIK